MDNKKVAIIAGIGIAIGVGVLLSKRLPAGDGQENGDGGEAVPTLFCCPICPDTCFSSQEALEEHMNADHPPEIIDIGWE